MEMYTSGSFSMSSGLADTLLPPMGTMLIDSVPPATATSYIPEVMLWAA